MVSVTRMLGLALAVLGFATTLNAEPVRRFPVADKPVIEDRYPSRVSQFPQAVTGLADVVYSSLPGYRPLRLDLYLPPKSATPKPLIVYIHGGGWFAGHTRHNSALENFPNVLASLAAEGFVVASLEYRLSGEARFPAQLQDVRAAIRFLKSNAGKYSIDSSRVGLWGGSAGGHLTALATVTCGVTDFDNIKAAPNSECVQAAATWYGVFDFSPILKPSANDPVRRLLGCLETCDADMVHRASPITYVNANTPPFLLIHGDEDSQVPVAQSHAMEAKLRAAGVPVQAIYIPSVDHSFIGKTPSDTRNAVLKALNATFDYFHQKLDRKAK